VGVCSGQPIAKGKGVLHEEESEGSHRQISAPRYTKHIRHNRLGKATIQVEAQRLHRDWDVDMAGIWRESELSYHGRSHGRTETEL
jgi:hypothetical protein